MSGSYIDAAGPTIAADAANAAAGVASTMVKNAQMQSQAEAFITANGAQVNNGHSQVGIEPPSIVGVE